MQKEIMTLCIPRVDSNISKDYIYNVLGKLKVGLISKLTEIPIKNQEGFKRIIFNIKWERNEKSNDIRDIIDSRGTFNIVYNMPWFWKISEYKRR
jgi:hypothetical protein